VGADPKIDAVLFDAAGTLIELAEPVGETYARVARDHGVELSPWRIQDAFRRILLSAPPMVFPRASADEIPGLEREWWRQLVRSTFRAADSSVRFADFDACFDALWTAFSQPRAWRRRRGCRQALADLRARAIATAVVSNFDRRLPAILAGLELAPLLDAVVLPSDARAAKPDPSIFRLALERLSARASASIFVGDSHERDLAGARAVGMRAIDVADLATLRDLGRHLDAER